MIEASDIWLLRRDEIKSALWDIVTVGTGVIRAAPRPGRISGAKA